MTDNRRINNTTTMGMERVNNWEGFLQKCIQYNVYIIQEFENRETGTIVNTDGKSLWFFVTLCLTILPGFPSN